MIDYALAKKLVTRHKAALTRAKKKGPDAVIEAVDAFYTEFQDADLPLPDSWHTWEVAKEDAQWALRRTRINNNDGDD